MRVFIGVLGIMVFCSLGALSQAESLGAIELIGDAHFKQGFNVHAPKPGKKVIQGILSWEGSGLKPVWGCSQWSSKYTLADSVAKALGDGAYRFSDGSKFVIVSTGAGKYSDLVLGMDSRKEYGDKHREKGGAWPHLLVEQRFEECPWFSELAALPFQVDARLLDAERFELAGYTPNLHAAQFLIYFTVQNLNPASKGKGDYFWLGAPVYDDRWPQPKKMVKMDKGTAKMIFSPGGAACTSQSMHDGDWVHMKGDLLPIALDGLKTAWERGLLQDSKDLKDYRLGGMNMGWEIPGINRVSVQVRDLSLKAVLK